MNATVQDRYAPQGGAAGSKVVSSTNGQSSSKKRIKAPMLRKNMSHWGAVLWTSIILVFIATFWDMQTLAFRGKVGSESNYGFQESLHETRRVMAKATYTRQRGPLIRAVIEGYDPFDEDGLTHLEDAMGGLMSGPAYMFKRGQINVYDGYTKGETNLTLRISNLTLERVYWDNNNPDPCFDRQIYMAGQLFDFEEENKTALISEAQAAIGYVDVHCESNRHHGYLTISHAGHHGGAMVGRVYKVHLNLTLDDFPSDANTSAVTPLLELEEIGAFIEDRDYGGITIQYVDCFIVIAPLIIWALFSTRVASVQVVLNCSVVGGDNSSGGGGTTDSDGGTSANGGESGTESGKETDTKKRSAREYQLSGFMNPEVVKTWQLPFLHFFYFWVVEFLAAVSDRAGDHILQIIEPKFHYFNLDSTAVAWMLMSQELIAWALYVVSFGLSKEKNREITRGVLFAYQHLKFENHMLALLNYGGCLILFLEFLQVLEGALAHNIIGVMCGVIIVMNALLVFRGIKSQQLRDSRAGNIAMLSNRIPITTRAMANFLVSQVRTASSNSNSGNVKALASDEIPGLSFVGRLSDAIIVARPDYYWDAFSNGKSVQFQIVERNTTPNRSVDRLVNLGELRFELTRHWLHRGKQSARLL